MEHSDVIRESIDVIKDCSDVIREFNDVIGYQGLRQRYQLSKRFAKKNQKA